MELMVLSKGNNKYSVEDHKGRLLYTVKKKAFGQKFNLLDTNEYILYTLAVTGDERKPAFIIILNDVTFLKMECKSLFLDPTLTAESKTMKYAIVSKDRKDFDIVLNDKTIGHIKTMYAVGGDLQYDIDIENSAFDDYIPLFAVAVDKAFGEMNRTK